MLDPELTRIDIGTRRPPPRWAMLQRMVFDQLDVAASEFVDRYAREDGTLVWRDEWAGMDGSDDPYEAFQNLPLLYALGGGDHLLGLANRMWEGITWQWTQYGQLHDEFDGYYDWMHHGEGSLYVYFTGLAHPTGLKWKQRAGKFADLYADPAAGNFDPERGLIRSPLTGSRGPRFTVTAEDWSTHRPILRVSPFEDVPPGAADPRHFVLGGAAGTSPQHPDKPNPWLDDAQFAQILDTMNERMTRGDVPLNLNATNLITHAYAFTGREHYRAWVLAYAQTWLDRAKANGGLIPDNVGLSGVVGEYNDGKWWAGYYGWRWPHGLKVILEATTNAAVATTLLAGLDHGLLELPRLQMDRVWEHRQRSPGGHWLLPRKRFDDGWGDYQIPPFEPYLMLYAVTMADQDAERLDALELPTDWHQVTIPRTSGYDPELDRETKHLIANPLPWYDFIRGNAAGYPDRILEASLEAIAQQLARMRSADGDPTRWNLDHPYSIHMWQEMCPLIVEGLVQLTLGAPMHLSHGGLQHARFRYYDPAHQRPGLPPSTAALVSELTADTATLELVNLSTTAVRDVIVQAGGFAEHEITAVEIQDVNGRPIRTIDVTDSRLHVHLAAGTGARLRVHMRRYIHPPSYATPWTDPKTQPTIRPRTYG